MEDETESHLSAYRSSFGTNIIIPVVFLLVSGAAAVYFFGSHFKGSQDISSALENDVEKPAEVCLNDVVAERVAGLVAEQISKRTIKRFDPSDQLDGFRALGQLLDKQQGMLTSADQFQHRIALRSITFQGYNSVSNTVMCTGSISMQRLSSDDGDTYYKTQPRVRYQIQRTIDGSDAIVTIDNDRDIDRAGFLWADADGRASRVAKPETTSESLSFETAKDGAGRQAECSINEQERTSCTFTPRKLEGQFDGFRITMSNDVVYNFDLVRDGIMEVESSEESTPLGRFFRDENDAACWSQAERKICVW